MFGALANLGAMAKSAFSPIGMAIGKVADWGLKPIRYFIDSRFRDGATPVAGSVVYSDLYLFMEHSGIYVGDDKIANIVVDSLATADSTVRLSDPSDFTQKAKWGKKIYVSCRDKTAVGSFDVSDTALGRVGEKSFYGLVFSNCHAFSVDCLSQDFSAQITPSFDISFVKSTARRVLGANKWRLWDWDNTAKDTPEPNWQYINNELKRHLLTPQYRQQLKDEIAKVQAYEQEIQDENLPDEILNKLNSFRLTLQKVADKYDEMAEFLAVCGHGFSYEQLEALSDNTDFTALAKEMKNNTAIKELVKKMGRNYIAEDKKRTIKVPKSSRSEIHGTHHSDDLMRMLPSELVNIDDEDLQMLFYARLLEKNLTTYQLSGVTYIDENESYQEHKKAGAIVACLDTSSSMSGQPMLKAKATLFAIANILKSEQRSLSVLLFGASGQIKRFDMTGSENLAGLLAFLQQGFNGGTDFDTPLQTALDIIKTGQDYQKADILMLSDGDCQLSETFSQKFHTQKHQARCMVYSVLCNGSRRADNFSDETIVL